MIALGGASRESTCTRMCGGSCRICLARASSRWLWRPGSRLGPCRASYRISSGTGRTCGTGRSGSWRGIHPHLYLTQVSQLFCARVHQDRREKKRSSESRSDGRASPPGGPVPGCRPNRICRPPRPSCTSRRRSVSSTTFLCVLVREGQETDGTGAGDDQAGQGDDSRLALGSAGSASVEVGEVEVGVITLELDGFSVAGDGGFYLGVVEAETVLLAVVEESGTPKQAAAKDPHVLRRWTGASRCSHFGVGCRAADCSGGCSGRCRRCGPRSSPWAAS